MFSWHQIRHAQMKRRPMRLTTHTEERIWRDESTQPDPPEWGDELAPCLICGEPKPDSVRCDCWERKP
jgi:hypothetical protein